MKSSAASGGLWRVVAEQVPLDEDTDALAVVRVFDEYEQAWQFAQASYASGAAVELIDPAGRPLIDTSQGQAFPDAGNEIALARMPAGVYRWRLAARRYEFVQAEAAEQGAQPARTAS